MKEQNGKQRSLGRKVFVTNDGRVRGIKYIRSRTQGQRKEEKKKKKKIHDETLMSVLVFSWIRNSRARVSQARWEMVGFSISSRPPREEEPDLKDDARNSRSHSDERAEIILFFTDAECSR